MSFNVLQLTNSFHPGGSERQAVQLARLLHESGRCRVFLACLDASGALLDEARQIGSGEIYEYPLNSFYNLNALKQLRRLATFLREHEIGVVQTHDFYSNVFGMLGARLARVPVRIASKRETGGMRTPAQRRVELQAFRLAHAVIVNAEAVGRQLKLDGISASKIVTVYNGLDLSRITPPDGWRRERVLAELGLPVEEPRRFVTIVANLEHEVKDHRMFLRAARRVHEAVPEAAFVLAGEGRLREPLLELAAELGLERDVFLIGRCTRIAELLAVSDACVLSSRAEGFSNSILEYMAAARAVVATDVGGAREALTEGETGFLVQPADDEAMAARLVSLLLDAELARSMGERGRRVVEQKFSTEAQLQKTLNLYLRLLAQRGALMDEPLKDAPLKDAPRKSIEGTGV
ncbi:MAG TPA: glycosyltransferase [Pyrinomonadaceae bacterium]|jgi:glycosyltransferase involved in cell wall biosynthesis